MNTLHRKIYRHSLHYILMLGLLFIAGCNNTDLAKPAAKNSVYEVSGTVAERIATVTHLVFKDKKLPSLLLDAHFLEEQIGDGVLGPSDYRSFSCLKVAVQDLAQWLQLLTPLNEKVPYITPNKSYAWWINQRDFAGLQFFEPNGLIGYAQGWIGIDQKTGSIYIFTFTT